MIVNSPLSSKVQRDGIIGRDYLWKDDFDQFIKEVLEIHKVWSDNGVTCPICDKEKRLWAKGDNICYDCKIKQKAGDLVE